MGIAAILLFGPQSVFTINNPPFTEGSEIDSEISEMI